MSIPVQSDTIQRERILAVMRDIGALATSPGVVLLCGGTTSVLAGWRDGTIDLDLGYLHEPGHFFESLARVKRDHDVSVDMVMPTAFVPLLPGGDSRHELIATMGLVEFRHFDFYTQALAKIARGHARDLSDIAAYVEYGKIDPAHLMSLFNQVFDDLVRYPSIDADLLRQKVREFVREQGHDASTA